MTPSTRGTGDRPESPTVPRRAFDWLRTRLTDASPLRPTAGGGLALLVGSVAVSLVASGPLEGTMRIRWSVGTHYGPAHAPTAVVLAAFPIFLAVAIGASRGLAAVLERSGEFDEVRAAYELAVLTVLLWLVIGQVALVVANLW